MSKYYYFSFDISTEKSQIIKGSNQLILIVDASSEKGAWLIAKNKIKTRPNYTGNLDDYDLSLYKVDDKKMGKCYPNKKLLEYTDH